MSDYKPPFHMTDKMTSLIAEISEEYDVAITAKDIIPANFNSAQAMYALIQRLEDEG